MSEFAKVTITVETSDSVLTIVIPKADNVRFDEITWPPATFDDRPIGHPPVTSTSVDLHMVARYDEETNMILSKEQKSIEN
ncbi:hypothetical protein MUDCAT_90 [Arthrobacter phage Mudcat]|uniref:Uncharacterized protein n=3 Tax=Mudcatvirus TaxID=1982088 RepID=A0A222Z762_9CAUD|nr:hypothetical protein BI184_gp90 [Arthrobacter phage Mudcat]YP_010666574.1 hypothetical protein PQB79_gp095 [Arthrobacter phage Heisenberger]YP_010666674.1 hypothetical protein PQB80_gp095 [Arthrobacter phage JEGGS]AMM44457.1 hypothetical protein MUDCAT_90 [Arthrobacter phage Mudcat]ASR80349.1 hypothetical protein SEA_HEISENBERGER_95 [Arthrobacter phage Heisenberger]QDM57578.1 hypothetical protein SEA_JEGGS_95 [Arthrobacter phage JEGGS]